MTAPFGAILESSLKENVQGATMTAHSGMVVNPQFYCCISGTSVGVEKDPAAVLIVAPIEACTDTAINADYSHSWSPSSTIVAWVVDWGDGNTSNGVWPGAGNVNHPGGGYALPGTYTVTLTITDLLGAFSECTQQVEIIDCTLMLIELFGSCGSSGCWYSENGGYTWETAGLDGIEIYDLKSSWFTFGTGRITIELWAATENGLYKTVNGGDSWKRIALPSITELGSEPDVAAVTLSKLEKDTAYVIAYNAATINTWLYKTIDGGENWDYVMLSEMSGVREVDAPIYRHGPKLAVLGGRLYGLSYTDGVKKRRIDGSGIWDDVAMGGITRAYQLQSHNGYLWLIQTAPNDHPVYWDGMAWNSFNYSNGNPMNRDGCSLYADNNGHLWMFSEAGDLFDDEPGIWDFSAGPGAYSNEWDAFGLKHTPGDSVIWYREGTDDVFISGAYRHLPGTHYCVYRGQYPPAAWPREFGLTGWIDDWENTMATAFVDWGGNVLASMNGTHLLRHVQVGVLSDGWVEWGPECENAISCVKTIGGDLYVATGEPARLYKLNPSGDRWIYIGEWNTTGRVEDFLEFEGDWFAAIFCTGAPGDDDGIYVIEYEGDCLPPDEGRTYTIDVTYNELHVFAGLIDELASTSILFRIASDLSLIERIYEPATGTWGGILCDLYDPRWVWGFGDFGAGVKAIVSIDYGSNWIDTGDPTWLNDELVRPLLVSSIDPNDIVAILNDDISANESWHSSDSAATWAKVGDTGFYVQSAIRDFYNDSWIWIGRDGAGATHLQFSPNMGVNWLERSTGFTANAPVTSIVVVG